MDINTPRAFKWITTLDDTPFYTYAGDVVKASRRVQLLLESEDNWIVFPEDIFWNYNKDEGKINEYY